ncbi:MAG: inositol monophosphatase [Acidimicrobiia bacterium]|nr:inositol monophosphatase [Acidimicrobiia bacterium]
MPTSPFPPDPFGPEDLDALTDAAQTAAHAGGAIVLEGFGNAEGVREKSPGDWVSDVDTGSEEAVRASLDATFPDIPFFGEEGGGERGPVGWYVDPLDGTANFLHRFPMVGVSVALVAGGRPVVGVIHAPMLGDTYRARQGGGAFRNGDPLAVSTRAPTSAIVATGFPFRRNDLLDRYLPVFDTALHDFEDLRRAGAASMDLAYTAAGSFDGYFELALGTWDVAAAAVLVREAGGVVTDWSGDPDAWLFSGDIVAAPPGVHVQLLEITAGISSTE